MPATATESASRVSGIPPIEPGAFPPEPPRWPRGIGILCIVYGAGGILIYGFCGIAGTLLQGWLLSFSGLKAPPMPPVLVWITAGQSVVLAMLGVLLVVGGVRLLQLRRSARPALAAWAAARIALLVVSTVAGLVTMPTQLDYQVAMNESVRDMMRTRGMSEAEVDRNAPAMTPADLQSRQRLMTFGMTVPLAAFPIFIGLLATSPRKRAEFDAFPSP